MKVILFLSLFLNTLQAEEYVRQIWSLRSEHYIFSHNPKTQILISDNCIDDSQDITKSSCAAAIALKNKNIKIAPQHFSGGRNPGAVACTQGLKKEIVILKDPKNNENAFCKFEDGSMIAAINLLPIIK